VAIPASQRAGLQGIELAEISQVVTEKFYNPSAIGEPGLCPLWVIRVGHDREDTVGYVRFAPKADKWADISVCPLSAKSDLNALQRRGVAIR
jgi:hypothetical protein